MKIYVVYIIIATHILVCQGCKYTITKTQKSGTVTIIDSITLPDKYNTPSKYLEPFYLIYYLGKIKDTYSIGQPIRRYIQDNDLDVCDTTIFKWKPPTPNRLKITVDTAFHLTQELIYRNWDNPNHHTTIDSIRFYKSFTFFMENLSTADLYIGNFNFIELMIKQFKHCDGQWTDAEIHQNSYCITGARELYLRSREIMLGKFYSNNGPHKVECRLKYKYGACAPVYSNIFYDNIDTVIILQKIKELQPYYAL